MNYSTKVRKKFEDDVRMLKKSIEKICFLADLIDIIVFFFMIINSDKIIHYIVIYISKLSMFLS